MNNPFVSAAISLVGIGIIASMMLFTTEAPGSMESLLQWVFLAGAVIGLIGSLIMIAERRRR